MPSSPPILVLGVGNAQRGDDAAGLRVARKLRAMQPPGLKAVEAGSDCLAMMEAWKDAQTVILVDAMVSGAEPGTIRRFEAHAQPLPKRFFPPVSTHDFGLAKTVELARALGTLPPRVIVYGIEGRNFTAGAALSPEVAAAVDETARQILREARSGE